jgi:hypothetical protein
MPVRIIRCLVRVPSPVVMNGLAVAWARPVRRGRAGCEPVKTGQQTIVIAIAAPRPCDAARPWPAISSRERVVARSVSDSSTASGTRRGSRPAPRPSALPRCRGGRRTRRPSARHSHATPAAEGSSRRRAGPGHGLTTRSTEGPTRTAPRPGPPQACQASRTRRAGYVGSDSPSRFCPRSPSTSAVTPASCFTRRPSRPGLLVSSLPAPDPTTRQQESQKSGQQQSPTAGDPDAAPKASPRRSTEREIEMSRTSPARQVGQLRPAGRDGSERPFRPDELVSRPDSASRATASWNTSRRWSAPRCCFFCFCPISPTTSRSRGCVDALP